MIRLILFFAGITLGGVGYIYSKPETDATIPYSFPSPIDVRLLDDPDPNFVTFQGEAIPVHPKTMATLDLTPGEDISETTLDAIIKENRQHITSSQEPYIR